MQAVFPDRIKSKLAQKAMMVFCLAVAIAGKSIIALSYSSLKGDKSLYLLFAKSFLEAGLLAEPVKVLENGGSYYLYNPAVHSPLYSLLAAPFLWLTKSYFLTQYILSVFSWILFYIALYQVLKLIFQHRWQVALFVLCSAFFIYPHELSSPPKDTFAIGFVLWSIVLIDQLLKTNARLIQVVLLSMTLFCTITIKLLYIPIAIALLCISLVYLFKKRTKHSLHTQFLLGTLVALSALLYFFVLQPVYSLENPTVQLSQNSTNTSGGFHLDYLQYTFPFITSSIINTNLWGVQIERFTSLSFADVMQVFFRIDVLMFIGLTWLLLLFRNRIMANRPLMLLVVTSLLMIGVVFGLSITGHSTTYKSNGSFWAFVMDARSFLLPMITLQIGLFLLVFQMKKFYLLRIALFLLFFFNCAHGFYFTAKETLSLKKGSDESSNDAQTKITAMLAAYKTSSPKLITSDLFLKRYAQVKDIDAYSFSNLSPNLSWMKKGDHFLVATFPQDTLYRNYFPAADLRVVDTIRPFVIHHYTVK